MTCPMCSDPLPAGRQLCSPRCRQRARRARQAERLTTAEALLGARHAGASPAQSEAIVETARRLLRGT